MNTLPLCTHVMNFDLIFTPLSRFLSLIFKERILSRLPRSCCCTLRVACCALSTSCTANLRCRTWTFRGVTWGRPDSRGNPYPSLILLLRRPLRPRQVSADCPVLPRRRPNRRRLLPAPWPCPYPCLLRRTAHRLVGSSCRRRGRVRLLLLQRRPLFQLMDKLVRAPFLPEKCSYFILAQKFGDWSRLSWTIIRPKVEGQKISFENNLKRERIK
jgi:hypothetical protein